MYQEIIDFVQKVISYYLQILYDATFLRKFSGAAAAESYIERSLETVKGYFTDDSLGTTLAIEIMGDIEYVNKNIRVDDNKSHKQNITCGETS